MVKVVVLKLRTEGTQQDFAVNLEIANNGEYPFAQVLGTLPKSLEVDTHHDNWQNAYRDLDIQRRFGTPQAGRTSKDPQQCSISATELKNSMKQWFDHPQFSRVRETIYRELNRSDEIRLLIQTEDSKLRQLPWHLFFDSFLDLYRQAEIALSSSEYYKPNISSANKRSRIRILAILGDRTGIDLEADIKELRNLPDNPEIVFLAEPQRPQLDDYLRDETGWDILFFAGHSSSDKEVKTGYINLNKTTKLQISELKYGLVRALERGLQLAIFNSCDGLGLAQELAELHIPQIIVMREPVPDKVAQAFLKYFLQDFSRSKPLYLAVREARERLTALESDTPHASWLPVIYQLPNKLPPTWRDLCPKISNSPHPETTQSPPAKPSPKPATTSQQDNINKKSPVQPPTTPATPKTTASQPLNAKNLTDYIKALPKTKEYPVYQVFGVICSFYQYEIATPPEILPLCLPEYSSAAVQKVVDIAINNELKSLVLASVQGRFQRLQVIDNVTLQKAIAIYPPKSAEKYLTTAIPALAPTEEIHQRWISHCLRGLATNGEDNLVLKILQDYPDKISALQPQEDAPEWPVWIKIYAALRQKHPEDSKIRSKHLGLISRYGTEEQKRSVIEETKSWLLKHPQERVLHRLYLALVAQSGSQQQQQQAIAQTTTWLQNNYSSLQNALPQDKTIRDELIPLLQKFINLALDNYPQNRDIYQILFKTFGWFRDYLNDKHCDLLATFIVHHPLNIPITDWVQFINAANIFRDFHNDFKQAQKTYLQVLNAAKSQANKPGVSQEIKRILRYTQLNYARLLIIQPAPKPDEALQYLKDVINDNPKHGLAHLYIAQCYQIKGANFAAKVRECYQKAIELDREKNGYFWYEFGCFYRYIFKNSAQARNCFEESLKQKPNLGAYVELGDLEAGSNNFSRAKELLQQGCNLERLIRREKYQWRQLAQRMQNIDTRINNHFKK
ncbi:Appr-1-p processing domain protein [Calothrix brevissima NIES-22]|nr:Appr-1-p processing domain protein [Calothrix brevissima NIES-22]